MAKWEWDKAWELSMWVGKCDTKKKNTRLQTKTTALVRFQQSVKAMRAWIHLISWKKAKHAVYFVFRVYLEMRSNKPTHETQTDLESRRNVVQEIRNQKKLQKNIDCATLILLIE